MKNFKPAVICCLIPLLLMISCAGSPDNSGKPDWVDNVNSAYNRMQYIAAVGYSQDRQTAERNAIANLSAYFSQSIQADQTIRNSYYEAARNGRILEWIDNIEIQDVIRTTSSMDTLIGAEIREIWFDEKSKIYYAAAVMERQKTIRLYTDMINANLEVIKKLVSADQAERDSLEAVSRYRAAGTFADMNTSHANLLNVLSAPIPNGVTTGDQYRLEALNVTKAIPVSIIVTGDRSARVQSAFANVFSELGFRTGAGSAPDASRYVLYVNIVLTNPDYPNYQWVQMELSANLTDAVNALNAGSAAVLLPYSFTSREGHTTTALAENRVFLSAEQKIASEYKTLLSSYLDQLLPK